MIKLIENIDEISWDVKYDIEVLENTEIAFKGIYKNCSLECVYPGVQADFSVDIDEKLYKNLYEDAPDDDFVCITQDDLDKKIIIFTETNYA